MSSVFVLGPNGNWLYGFGGSRTSITVPVAQSVIQGLSVVTQYHEVGKLDPPWLGYYCRIWNPHPWPVAFEFALTFPKYFWHAGRAQVTDDGLPPARGESPAVAILDAAGDLLGTLPRRRHTGLPALPGVAPGTRQEDVTLLELPATAGFEPELGDGEDVREFHARVQKHVRNNRASLSRHRTLFLDAVEGPDQA